MRPDVGGAAAEWFYRRGQLADAPWESVVKPGIARDWGNTGLRIAQLDSGVALRLEAADAERLVVPLSGSFSVRHGLGSTQVETILDGRSSVFAGPTDVLYLASGSHAEIAGDGHVAIADARTSERRPTRHIVRDDVPVELRGAGASTRQVHNFGTPDVLDAARLIVCEVITPAGNWSSYPPHKHDELIEGRESRLEEIYYFEVATARGAVADAGANPFGMFNASPSPAGEIRIDEIVRTGDIALVPYGYHGPAVAAPGYDLYYLNVMAGPDPERVWSISDDPAHAWVRDLWQHEPQDARLPYTSDPKGDR